MKLPRKVRDNKLRQNKERDARNTSTLQAAGWDVLVVWECDTKNIDALGEELTNFLNRPKIF
jgi:DNA mismatch endonuclease (patch repair protein)